MAGERKFVTENIRRVLVKEYFMRETKKAGFGGLDIQRTPMGTRVTLLTERPGLVIGRRGSTIKTLTDAVEFDFKFDKPQIEVVEVKQPNLNAQIMAEKLASALERGWHFRRAGHSTVRRIMGSGARGCQIIISGKLTGQRHRMEKFKEGHIKFCGDPKLKWMEQGFAVAKLKAGVIGVKVQIMNPDAKLPDEVSVIKPTIQEVIAQPKPVGTDDEEKTDVESIETTEEKPTDKKDKKKAKKDKRTDKSKSNEKSETQPKAMDETKESEDKTESTIKSEKSSPTPETKPVDKPQDKPTKEPVEPEGEKNVSDKKPIKED